MICVPAIPPWHSSCRGVKLGFPGEPSGKSWNSPDLPSADESSSPAAQLELFDDVADLLKPVHVPLLLALIVGNHLEKEHSQSGIPAQLPSSNPGNGWGAGHGFPFWLIDLGKCLQQFLWGSVDKGDSVTGSAHKDVPGDTTVPLRAPPQQPFKS